MSNDNRTYHIALTGTQIDALLWVTDKYGGIGDNDEDEGVQALDAAYHSLLQQVSDLRAVPEREDIAQLGIMPFHAWSVAAIGPMHDKTPDTWHYPYSARIVAEDHSWSRDYERFEFVAFIGDEQIGTNECRDCLERELYDVIRNRSLNRPSE